MTRRGVFHDDPDPLAREVSEVGDLPIFAAHQWPERAAEEAEQTVAPVKGTIEERYQTWRRTEDGQRVFAAYLKEALRKLGETPFNQRKTGCLRSKAIWEVVRDRLRISCNNDFTALAAREAERVEPALFGLFERRRRVAT